MDEITLCYEDEHIERQANVYPYGDNHDQQTRRHTYHEEQVIQQFISHHCQPTDERNRTCGNWICPRKCLVTVRGHQERQDKERSPLIELENENVMPHLTPMRVM
jgi:hypothetical protein